MINIKISYKLLKQTNHTSIRKENHFGCIRLFARRTTKNKRLECNIQPVVASV